MTRPSYPVRLAGTRHYQGAISFARPGNPVELLREPDNVFDADAIAVVDADGETLGYIPADSWLRRALIADGRGCRARILSIDAGVMGDAGVGIAVTLRDDAPIGARVFTEAAGD